jgi:hypothetical protein
VSAADWAYLAARTSADFANGGHRTYFVPSLTAVAATAIDVSAFATAAAASAAAASASLATQVALGLPANGVGNEPLDLPRMSMFNGEAFRQWDQAAALVVNTQDATYQITEHDRGKLLLVTSGTRTWTLPPASADLIGWTLRLRNRSGNNLTLNTGSASDAINGGSAGSGITVATASAILTVVCTGATAFEVA